MTAFVEECRKEWKRLGVPDLLADEMATELESDLSEAEADGVSATEMLGESDPRRFAANWAGERGLVSGPAPTRRRRTWPWVVLGLVVFFVLLLTWLSLQTLGSSHAAGAPPVQVTPERRVNVPNVVGMKACRAVRVLTRANVHYRRTAGRGHGYPCDLVVVAQTPVGRVVKRGFHEVVVTLRLGPR
jgi:hypothetical protein